MINTYRNAYNQIKYLTQREINYTYTIPIQALLFMTYRCTSTCKMCNIWRAGQTCDINKELTLKEWKEVLENIGLHRLKSIEIFGGDSLLRKDISIPLIEFIKEKNESIFIDYPTNCNLLDKDTAYDLVKAGVGKMYISLDAPSEIHDTIRGKHGTTSNVEKAIRYLKDAREELHTETPEICINCTISSLNIDHFEKIIPLAEELGIDTVEFEYVGEFKQDAIDNTSINGVHPTPFYTSPSSSNLLTEKQAIALKKKMKQIRHIGKTSALNIITYAIDVLTIQNLICGTVPNKKCYYCRYCITINPFGDMMGCFHYNNYLFGNLTTSSFSSIWNKKRHHQFLQAQQRGDIKLCQQCVSGVNRNSNIIQALYRSFYFRLFDKGFDTP